jgi:hypothetical protein
MRFSFDWKVRVVLLELGWGFGEQYNDSIDSRSNGSQENTAKDDSNNKSKAVHHDDDDDVSVAWVLHREKRRQLCERIRDGEKERNFGDINTPFRHIS